MPESNFTSNWDDLAKRLGVSRRAIQDWRKDPRYKSHCPRPRPDGRHDVAAWAGFMVACRLKRADTFVDSTAVAASPFGAHDHDDEDFTHADPTAEIIRPPKIAGSQADWQKGVLREKFEKERISRLTLEGTLLVAAELEVPLGATFAAIQIKLTQFAQRVARHVKGLRDEAEIETVLREEIDADLTDLQAARYLDVTIAEIIQDLPFDSESERLLKLVTFAEQDRASLLELIARVSLEALRRLGRRAIANAGKSKKDEDEIADAVTGQVTDAAQETQNSLRAAASPSESASGNAAPSPVVPGSSREKEPSSAGSGSRAAKPAKKKRKSRPKPAQPPGEVEASIHATPRKKRRK